eukprot:m.253504 g.253504  ORF g.253504 m.253504 type:complete len:55 (+) comp54532_c0_seq38:1421-1585(+)
MNPSSIESGAELAWLIPFLVLSPTFAEEISSFHATCATDMRTALTTPVLRRGAR